jgi:hypothetical protein
MVRDATAIAQKPARRRGRPAARVFSPAEAAELLNAPESRVLASLEIAAPSFFPNARRKGDSWEIPERDLRALVGPELPQLLTVEEFATLTRLSLRQVYRLIQCGVVKHRRLLGYYRIPEAAYWELPAEMPADVPARPQDFHKDSMEQNGARSFFSAGEAGAGTKPEVHP